MILTVCLNPALQKTLVFSSLKKECVNRTDTHFFSASGKGMNVSRVISSLGGKVTHITQLGMENKDIFINLSKDDGVDIDFASCRGNIRYCYTVLEAGGKTTELVEEGCPVDECVEKNILDIYARHLDEASTVVITGSKAKGFSSSLFPCMVFEALQRFKTVFCDFRGNDLINTLEKCRNKKNLFVKINRDELLSTFAGNDEKDSPDTVFIQKNIFKVYGIPTIITDGVNPVSYFDGNNSFFYDIIRQDKTVNTTGCGDAFAGGFAFEYEKTHDAELSIKKALLCASLNAASYLPGKIR